MTLDEYNEYLKKTGKWEEFVARKNEQDEIWKQLGEKLRRAEAPLVEALRLSGVTVSSVYDLVNRPTSNQEAIKTLICHLDSEYPERIREGIIRALTVSAAAGIATKRLIEEFESLPTTSPPGLKWVVGNALEPTLTDDFVDDVLELLSNPVHGEARQMLPFAVARFRKTQPRVLDVLETLTEDPQIGREVKKALKGESPDDRG